MGAIPKHDGGWRIIYHLSAPPGLSINDFIDSDSYSLSDGGLFIIYLPPPGLSINDFIDSDSYSLSYCSVDDAYTIINELGTGALLYKIDFKNVFRLIPVQQSDWNLLGIHGRDRYYIDTCLPFGWRSVPFLFNQLADTIHWILHQQYGVRHLLLLGRFSHCMQALPIPTHASPWRPVFPPSGNHHC